MINENIENIKWYKKYKSLLIIIGVCIVIFLCGLLMPYFMMDESNNFGDTAGAINGLFSALAFAGVIYAIFMQREELELQRKELEQTREELKGQKAEFQIQNDTMKRQRFENTFFNMLQLQQQITDNITFSYIYVKNVFNEGTGRYEEDRKPIDLKGREVFRAIFEDVPQRGSDNRYYDGMRYLIDKDGLTGYKMSDHVTYFDHYFRNLYRIIKFIATSQLIKDEDRYEYASLVRGQLSRYELVWLYYNGLSVYGYEKFKPLIERFSLLKNLREELLVNGEHLNPDYDQRAFTHSLK